MENKPTIIEMMTSTLTKIREMVDVNTVVGNPLTTGDGTTVIPVSRVSFGFGAGGSDWTVGSASTTQNFGGGAGAGVSVTPVSFLVVTPNGVRIIPVEPAKGSSTVDKVVDMIPTVVDKVEQIINKYK